MNNLCVIAEVLRLFANSHHDAKITAVELIQAQQWTQSQCEDAKKTDEAKAKAAKPAESKK